MATVGASIPRPGPGPANKSTSLDTPPAKSYIPSSNPEPKPKPPRQHPPEPPSGPSQTSQTSRTPVLPLTASITTTPLPAAPPQGFPRDPPPVSPLSDSPDDEPDPPEQKHLTSPPTSTSLHKIPPDRDDSNPGTDAEPVNRNDSNDNMETAIMPLLPHDPERQVSPSDLVVSNQPPAPDYMALFPQPAERSNVNPAAIFGNSAPEIPIQGAGNDHAAQDLDQPETPRPDTLEPYAKLVFADSTFFMTTRKIIIGRDCKALRQAKIDEEATEEYRKAFHSYTRGGPVPTPIPPHRSKDLRRKYSHSFVSEEGGIVGPQSKPPKDSGASHSSAEAAQQDEKVDDGGGSSDGTGAEGQDGAAWPPFPTNHPKTARAAEGTVDEFVPFVPIHAPGPDIFKNTKSISRKHLTLEFDRTREVFYAAPIGKNGFFVEDHHYDHETGPVVLRSGVHVQIRDVSFRFYIYGVQSGRTGGPDERAVLQMQGLDAGKNGMSFEFESSHRVPLEESSDEDKISRLKVIAETGIDPSGPARPTGEGAFPVQPTNEVLNYPLACPTRQQDDARTQALEREQKHARHILVAGMAIATENLPPELAHLAPGAPKKRGPGRPPKNGYISKREEKVLKNLFEERAAEQRVAEPGTGPLVAGAAGGAMPVVLGLAGHARPSTSLPPVFHEEPPKRPPKRKADDDPDGSTPPPATKVKKEKRPAREKTPPLQKRERSEFTEEELKKPNKTYAQIIFDVLTEPGMEGGLALRQIYKRICKKWPHFVFETQTKGWESSVRHNLAGAGCFAKNQEGLWYRIPGQGLDSKKRKPEGGQLPSDTPAPKMPKMAMAHNGFPMGASIPKTEPSPVAGFGHVPTRVIHPSEATKGTYSSPYAAGVVGSSAPQPGAQTASHFHQPVAPAAAMSGLIAPAHASAAAVAATPNPSLLHTQPHNAPPAPARLPGLAPASIAHTGMTNGGPAPAPRAAAPSAPMAISHASSVLQPSTQAVPASTPVSPLTPQSQSQPQQQMAPALHQGAATGVASVSASALAPAAAIVRATPPGAAPAPASAAASRPSSRPAVHPQLVPSLLQVCASILPALRKTCTQADAIVYSGILSALGLIKECPLPGATELVAFNKTNDIVGNWLGRWKDSMGITDDNQMIRLEVRKDITRFREAASSSFKSHTAMGDLIVASAISRALGLCPTSIGPKEFHRAEEVTLSTVQKSIKKFSS